MLGTVNTALGEAEKQLGDQFDLWLTGGDSDVLLPFIRQTVRRDNDLVLGGLAYALP